MLYSNMADKKSYVSNTSDRDDNNTSSVMKNSDDYNTSANAIGSEASLPSSTVELDIQDIEGIGPTTAKKLKDAALEKRRSMLRCSTGSSALDDLLLGGIETQAVTEFYGEFGSGKSQVCHTLCVMARQPVELGGLDGNTIYIDTEGTFRPERIQEIARSRGYEQEQVLKSIAVCKVYNSSHLELIIKNLGKYVDDFKAKLVIIDSIISLHRAEFAGRGTLADRQQRLNSMLHKIIRLAEIYNIAIVITNQVQSSPDTFFGDPTKAAGGNVLGHASTYRVYLRKSGENRIAKMIDSPYHPYSDTRFTVNEKGIDDLEEQIKKVGRKSTKDEDAD